MIAPEMVETPAATCSMGLFMSEIPHETHISLRIEIMETPSVSLRLKISGEAARREVHCSHAERSLMTATRVSGETIETYHSVPWVAIACAPRVPAAPYCRESESPKHTP